MSCIFNLLKLKFSFELGGIAGSMAVGITHPLDTLKVHLQTQADNRIRLLPFAAGIVRRQGLIALYNGLSASVLRQLSYTTARFAIYEEAKEQLCPDTSKPPPFYMKIGISVVAGGIGGICGAPADLINVRMQNDVKLAVEKRRNYAHAIDGLYQVIKNEGVFALFNGSSMVVARCVLMTVGQLSFYDQTKQMLLGTSYFEDDIKTHLTASSIAACGATAITQPMDVMKTRLQNSKPGEYRGTVHCIADSFKTGGIGVFYKGFAPALVRLAPHTVLTFIFFEQLRQRFGKAKAV